MVIRILKTTGKIVVLAGVAIMAQIVAGKAGKSLAKTINEILD